jgi:hypothetical protein
LSQRWAEREKYITERMTEKEIKKEKQRERERS